MEDTEQPGLGMRILLVDDDDVVREVFGDLIAELGAEVAMAASVAEARRLLDQFRPTAVITDVFMPVESGFVMRAEVQRWNAAVPVVALTGAGDSEVTPAAGFTHVLQKPLVLDTLAALLKALPRQEGSS